MKKVVSTPRAAGLPEYFVEMIEKAVEGIWVMDEKLSTVYINPYMVELLGYSKEYFLSRPVSDFFYPDDELQYIEEVKARKAGKIGQYELRFKHASGLPVWCQVVSIPKMDDAGSFQGTTAFLRNVTQRKRIDEILQSRLRLLEVATQKTLPELLQATLDEAELLTGSKIGFFHFVEEDQQNLTLQMWSSNTLAKMCTIEGRGQHYPITSAGVWVDCVATKKAVIHNDYASLPHRKGMPEGHAPVVREVVVPVLRAGKIDAIMGVGNKTEPYNDEDVVIVSTLADLAWDIAKTKRGEEQLAESERQFRLLAQIAPVGIFMTTMEGLFTFVNQRCSELTGYTPTELLQQSWMKIVHPDDLNLARGQWREIADTTQAFNSEFRLQRLDGKSLWVYAKVSPMKNDAGSDEGIIGVLIDITERKEAADKMSAMLADKEALLRELYHRTKNNLQIIVSMLRLESSSVHDNQTQEMLAELEGKIGSMALVHQKLYQSRNLSSINLEEYMNDLAGLLLDSFNIHPSKIRVKLDLSQVEVPIDQAIPCGLILNELITNAFKHAFPGERNGQIDIRLKQPDPDTLLLEVSDDGVGVPPGLDLESQVNTLGLRTVKALGELQLHGKVIFRSQGGFCCQVFFPLQIKPDFYPVGH